MAIASVLTAAVSSRRRLLVEICANAVLQCKPGLLYIAVHPLSPPLSRARTRRKGLRSCRST